ncbi:hypothetical protein NDU88_004258 [Pleurodeles waltl]|uniref:Uncharacterized protein n=1 Tax=Pleurodeles waltl TaxID=8319 RepID=A0AAV7RHL9_PLEWA|nr:hypothetical protein NDU88_004258 [Pleurodeles waltl]
MSGSRDQEQKMCFPKRAITELQNAEDGALILEAVAQQRLQKETTQLCAASQCQFISVFKCKELVFRFNAIQKRLSGPMIQLDSMMYGEEVLALSGYQQDNSSATKFWDPGM